MNLKYFVIIATLTTALECSRVLVLFPTISKSHIIPLQTLSLALANRGHEITFVSTYPLGKDVKNYRDVRIPFDEADKTFLDKAIQENTGNSIGLYREVAALLARISNETMHMKEMRRMMKEEKFDLVIVGYFFLTENMLGFADHFKCPSILFSPAGALSVINQAIGNPLGVAGSPHPTVATEMNFVGRLKTFLVTGLELAAMKYFKYLSRQIYDSNFPADRYRSYDDSLRNVSLALVNTHFSSGHPRPNLPNLIEVGGIQVKPKPSPLPEDLKKFLDGAKEGAIFFSLGSNVKASLLNKDTIEILLKVFAQLKQRVVMKWDADSITGKPENVLISKWLPQDDILAHKNLRLFISHCGLGGLVESKYHGVPIIGMPLFADQFSNAEKIASEGWGLKVDMATLTEKALKDAILEIFGNPKYATTVKRYSELAQDRPLNAQDTAIYWVEYVLRHHGAPHYLHYPGADLNIFQYNSLDVIVFLIAIVYVAFKLLKFVCRKLFCGWRKPKAPTGSKKQKKN